MRANLHTIEIARRYSASAAIAVFVTGGLLLVMHYAIHTEEPDVAVVVPIPNLQLLPSIPEDPVIVRPDIPPEPPKPEKLPPAPKLLFDAIGGGWHDGPIPVPRPGPRLVGVNNGLAEGDYLPIMKVPPEYPNRMLSRGIEGWVLVEFTVDKLGRVQAPRVVDAQPGSGFNVSALRAVMRYKYRPRVVNGETVPVQGVRQRIVFNISV